MKNYLIEIQYIDDITEVLKQLTFIVRDARTGEILKFGDSVTDLQIWLNFFKDD